MSRQTFPFRQQISPSLVNPTLQVNPQLVPSQVAVAFAGDWHGVHDSPQVAGSALLTQVEPHKCCPVGQPHVNPGPLHGSPVVQAAAQQIPLTGLQLPLTQSLSSSQATPSPSSGRHCPPSQCAFAVQWLSSPQTRAADGPVAGVEPAGRRRPDPASTQSSQVSCTFA